MPLLYIAKTLHCLQTGGSAWHSPADAAGQRTPWGTAPGSQDPVQQRVTGSSVTGSCTTIYSQRLLNSNLQSEALVQQYTVTGSCTIIYSQRLLYNNLQSQVPVQQSTVTGSCTTIYSHRLLYNNLQSQAPVQQSTVRCFCKIIYSQRLLYIRGSKVPVH